jgi:hypothetical protein
MTKKFLLDPFFIFIVIFLYVLTTTAFSDYKDKKINDIPTSLEGILLRINKEVCALGYRDNEDFIKREFHFELDGREDNREEHIVVISHPYHDYTKFIMQVTYFEAGVRIGSVRPAREFKAVLGEIKNNQLEILKNSYTTEESRSLFRAILAGIQEEIRLYRLIKKEVKSKKGEVILPELLLSLNYS